MSKKNLFKDEANEKAETKTENNTGYQVKNAKELKYYHVSVENVAFDPKTGNKLSKPSIQILTSQEYKTLRELSKRNGLTVEVLHSPEQ